jgi:hypothetical protein
MATPQKIVRLLVGLSASVLAMTFFSQAGVKVRVG